jgi:hypothetical protein
MRRGRFFRATGLIILALATIAGIGALVVHDQISRHSRDLFSTNTRQRLAALGYLGGLNASVELVQLLRDYAAWEPRTLLRRRAQQILARMERQLQRNGPRTGIAG